MATISDPKPHSFPKCGQSSCEESALSFSKVCWSHADPDRYLSDLRQSIARSDRNIPLALNLKKVECEGLDLSHLNLRDSFLSQTKMSRCLFIGADLSEASLIGANFTRCDFVGTDLAKANLTRATFTHCSFSYADLRGAQLTESIFRDTDLMGAMLWRVNLWNADISGAAHLKKKNFYHPSKPADADRARLSESEPLMALESYRNVKHYFYGKGLVEDAGWAAYRELTMERKHFYRTKDSRYIPSLLMDLLSGYTEKPNRAILSSIGIIFFFGIFYYWVGAVRPVLDPQTPVGLWDNIYFSIMTFTTVGFGDFVPKPMGWVRILVCLEAFTGPFMAGLYIFTLTRKYSAH